jgi:O-methyltransferase
MIKKLRLRSKIKGVYFLLRLQYIFPTTIFNFIAHFSALSKFINRHRKIEFSDFYTIKFNHSKRYKLFEYLLEKEELNTQGIDYLEFGVSKGHSFKWWIENNNNSSSKFHGFDTFTGLPEDWGPYKKGDMSSGNEQPLMPGNRHQYYQGLFQETLPQFLTQTKFENSRKLIHMDADLYSSTLFVLTSLSTYLRKGDIILFDEFNVPMHEFKAFKEWTESFYIDYEVLGAVNNFYQMAIKLK